MLTVTILLDSVEKVQRFVSKISRYSCGFDVECGNSCVDGKSLVGLFSLDISRPLQLTVNGGESEIEDVLRDINIFNLTLAAINCQLEWSAYIKAE